MTDIEIITLKDKYDNYIGTVSKDKLPIKITYKGKVSYIKPGTKENSGLFMNNQKQPSAKQGEI